MASNFCGIVKLFRKINLPRVSFSRSVYAENFPPEGKVPVKTKENISFFYKNGLIAN
jgi:hypothetical protein